jgi:hypothetical protein
MGDRRQEFQVGVRTSLRSACGYLLLLMEEGRVKAEGYTREQAWWSDDIEPIHQELLLSRVCFTRPGREAKNRLTPGAERLPAG